MITLQFFPAVIRRQLYFTRTNFPLFTFRLASLILEKYMPGSGMVFTAALQTALSPALVHPLGIAENTPQRELKPAYMEGRR